MMINGDDGTTWSIGRDDTLRVYRKGVFFILIACMVGYPGRIADGDVSDRQMDRYESELLELFQAFGSDQTEKRRCWIHR
jgi:hypothetical protein